MLRKSFLLGLSFLAATAAYAQEVQEPYPEQIQPAPPQQPPPPLTTAPPSEYPQYPPPAQYTPPPPTYYQQPAYMPAPPTRFHTVEQPRYGLMTAGLVLFGSSWSVNALGGYLGGEWRVTIPIVGPLMYANYIDNSPDIGTRTAVAGLVFDSLVEAAGFAMFLAGILTHHTVRVMDHAMIVPTAGGAAVIGRF